MTPEQFCYWLQGRAEMQPDNPPNAEEWKMIGEHLKLVFRKETPVRATEFNPQDLLKKAQENNRLQQPPLGGAVIGIPQCGIGQIQYGRNQPNIC